MSGQSLLGKRFSGLILSGLISLLLLSLSANVTQAAAGGFKVSNGRVTKNGAPYFVIGVNYEGHTDRAWRMWEYELWDADLVDGNFWLAKEAGINTLRIFVQKPLRDEIYYNNFSKLDKVFELANKHSLALLVTFNDYDEPDLGKEAGINLKIAERYRQNPALFGYDLKNEPQLVDIATANFGGEVPLQNDGFIKTYGERISQAEVDKWRQTNEGKGVIPQRLDPRRAYLYANAYRIYNDMLAAAFDFTAGNPGATLLDFIDAPTSQYWREFLAAIDGTLQKWLDVRLGAVRQADPEALVTVGWNNVFLAKARANQRLNFVSLHRFVPEGIGGVRETLAMLNSLRGSFPGQPVILEEFGYSNISSNGNALSQNTTASHETLLWLALYSQGFSGGFKWMLNNAPRGVSPYEAEFGLLDNSTSPKISYSALKAVAGYVNSHPLVTGKVAWMDGNNTDVFYNYRDNEAVFTNLAVDTMGPVRFNQPGNQPLAAWWNAGTGQINVIASTELQISFDIDVMFPSRNKSGTIALSVDGKEVPFEQSGAIVYFKTTSKRLFVMNIAVRFPAFQPVAPQSNGLFFKETGHNLKGSFRGYWERNGGLARYGFPLSEEFSETNPQDGKDYTVQYFERTRFEYHPENSGTNFEVLLGHLGRTVTSGRENDMPFQPVQVIASADKYFFKENGHTLGGIFKAYWEQNGGVAQFGLPISEEFQEQNAVDGKSYTVQYFERARFEYHPENSINNRVLLGLLGWQVVKAKGWL